MHHLLRSACTVILAIILMAQLLTGQSSSALNQQADSLRMLTQFDAARQLYVQADSIARSEGDWNNAIRAGASMSRMEFVEKQYSQAFARADSLLAVAKANDVHGVQVAACYNLQAGILGEWKNDFQAAYDLHLKALAELDTVTTMHGRDTRGRTIGSIGIALVNMGDLNGALRYYMEAIDTFMVIQGPIHRNVAIGYTSVADIHWMRGTYDDAIEMYERALAVQTQILPHAHPINIRVYRDLGECHATAGNLDQAMDNYTTAHDIAVQIFGEQSADAANTSFLIGEIIYRKGEPEEARKIMQTALDQMRQVYGELNGQVEIILNKLVDVYRDLGMNQQMLDAAQRSLVINRTIRPNHPATADSYRALAAILASQGHRQTAMSYYDSAMTIFEQVFESPHHEIANLYYEKSRFSIDGGDLDMARQYLNEARDEIGDPATPLAIRLHGLRLELATLAHEPPDSLTAIVLDGIRGIDIILSGFVSPGTQGFWLEELFPFYDQAINAVHALYTEEQTEQLFWLGLQIAEASKSALLQHHLRLDDALVNAGIPDSTFLRERQLKQNIRMYSSLLADAGSPAGPNQRTFWGDELRKTRASYARMANQLERDYPDYYRLKYSPAPFDPKIVQKAIPDDAIAVEYFYGDSTIHIFALNQKKHLWIEIDTMNIASDIELCRATTSTPTHDPNHNKAFILAAHRTYNAVIAPVIIEFPEVKRICIAADGPFYTLPFDLLISKASSEGNWQEQEFLIESVVLNYINRITDLAQETSRRPDLSYVGFAPQYKASPLPYARTEITTGAEIWNGRAYTDTSANERRFREISGRANILHLAAHAQIDNDHPNASRLFLEQTDSVYDHELHLYEIYGLKMKGQLAILSACQTGAGTLQRGEGLQSLSRAFQYAGVPAVAMSLWNVPDQPTSEIAMALLQELKAGYPKDVALQRAKLSYLEKSDLVRSHPYYWAGLIQSGDPAPIRSGRIDLCWIALLFVLSVLAIVVYRVFRT